MNTVNESVLIGGEAVRELAGLAEAGPAPSRIRVWLVDDSRNLRVLLAELLGAEEGFDCSRQFSSAEAVLEALSSEAPPDVILLDNQMGGMPGVEALRPIKALARATRVIMLTSCCDSETEARAFRDGASDFLSKNCGVIEIAMRIRLAWSNPEIPPVFEDSREEVLETPGCGAIERENKPRFSGAGRAVRTAKKYYWQVETRLWFGMSRIHAVLSRLGAGSIWWTDQDSELGNDVKSEV